MKYLLPILLLATNLTAQVQFFNGSWEKALIAAEKSNKLIFLDLYTTWCGPCKMMDKDIFPQPEVGDFMNAAFINVKMDAERAGKLLAKQFHVNSYPFLAFVTPQEIIIGGIPGATQAHVFLDFAKNFYYLSGAGMPLLAQESVWSTQPHTFETAWSYCQVLKSSGLDMSGPLEEFIRDLPGDSLDLPHYESLLLLFTTRTDGKAFQIIQQKQHQSPRFANKLHTLLETHCQKACRSGSEPELEKLISATEIAFGHVPAASSLKQTQFANRFFLDNHLEIRFVRNTTWFINTHLLPYLKVSPAPPDSTIRNSYAIELDNIGWQYATFINDQEALTNAADWLETGNAILGETVDRLYMAALIRKKTKDKPAAIRLLQRAVELGKNQGKDVAEMEKKYKKWQ